MPEKKHGSSAEVADTQPGSADDWANLAALAKRAVEMQAIYDNPPLGAAIPAWQALKHATDDFYDAITPEAVLRLLAHQPPVSPAEQVGWRPIETAPKDGTNIIGMARYRTATAGFPTFLHFMDGEWREPGRTIGEPMVCWAWMPRDVLGSWPAEPYPRTVTIQATGVMIPGADADQVGIRAADEPSLPTPPAEGSGHV